jgi:hypothetical protein
MHHVWIHSAQSVRICFTATIGVFTLLSADVVRNAIGMVLFRITARRSRETKFEITIPWSNKSLQPTPDGAGRSAFAGHVTGPAWLSFCR